MKNLFVVMGVSGCGKSTVAEQLAQHTDGIFLDADDFHPAANKAKMAAAIPLTDEDRWPWLEILNAELRKYSAGPQFVFLACSALRQAYRDRLADGLEDLQFIYLKGTKECILSRLEGRKNHFMPTALLDSQFAILEEPKKAIVLDIRQPINVLVAQALEIIRPD